MSDERNDAALSALATEVDELYTTKTYNTFETPKELMEHLLNTMAEAEAGAEMTDEERDADMLSYCTRSISYLEASKQRTTDIARIERLEITLIAFLKRLAAEIERDA